MVSVLVCVGCNHYDALSNLVSAEKDASEVFDALVAEGGLYDPKFSRLFNSPSLDEFRSAIREALSATPELDVLTFYFAAHGGVKSGNYYICFRDSRAEQLSLTSLPVLQLFTIVNEISPRQVNIVLDCCQSGGAMYELGALLRSAEVDASAAASVSFLAASRSNEDAGESEQGGLATRALLEMVGGSVRIQESRPFLDLVEVGRAVSAQLLGAGASQTPVTWGLNLYGEGRFAPNRHYRAPGDLPAFALAQVLPGSDLGGRIRENSIELWQEYRRFRDDPDCARLQALLTKLTSGIPAQDEVPFVLGFARALAARSRDSADVLAEPTAWGVAAVTMLGSQADEADVARQQLLTELAAASARARAALIESLRKEPRCLLNRGGGLSDLYYLPLRVSRLLGWVGCSLVVDALLEQGDQEAADQCAVLVDLLVEHYSGSFAAVGDEQAAWLHLFTAACEQRSWVDRATTVLDRIFASLASVQGAIAKPHLPGEVAFEYLLARSQRVAGPHRALARPVQLLPVLLLHGARLERAAEWDFEMRAFDRLAVNLFVPATYSDFGMPFIREGENFTLCIGDGVWSLDEYDREFRSMAGDAVLRAASSLPKSSLALAVVASELFPDRVALFVPDCLVSG